MIHEVHGDILKSRAQAIAHGVAPGDPFNQGLALALRERWPAMVKDFRHYSHSHHPKPGDVWTWGGPGVRIANLMTQEEGPKRGNGHPGRASVENVNHALRRLRQVIDEEGYESVALPRIATGVGGLTWDDVKPLIDHHLGDLKTPIYVYTVYEKGVEAEEPN